MKNHLNDWMDNNKWRDRREAAAASIGAHWIPLHAADQPLISNTWVNRSWFLWLQTITMDWPHAKSSIVADFFVSSSVNRLTDNPMVRKTVDGHPFNESVQLILPLATKTFMGRSQEGIDQAINQLKKSCPLLSGLMFDEDTGDHLNPYHKVSSVPLHLLFHKTFIQSYILNGDVSCISTDVSVDSDDCMCILPSGKMVLSLTEITYHKFGLEGQKSILFKKKNVFNKRTIEIDLRSPIVTKFDNSKYYKRCLRIMRRSDLVFNILFQFKPHSDKSDLFKCQTIASYFDLVKSEAGLLTENQVNQINVETINPVIRRHRNHRSLVPETMIGFKNFRASHEEKPSSGDQKATSKVLPDHDPNVIGLNQLLEETLEFTGAELLSISCMRDESDEVNSFGFNQETNPFRGTQVLCCEINGMIEMTLIKDILNEMEIIWHQLQDVVPFSVVIVNGFNDSIISWADKRNEHGKDCCGENLYGFLISPKSADQDTITKTSNCILWRIADAYDFGIEKLWIKLSKVSKKQDARWA